VLHVTVFFKNTVFYACPIFLALVYTGFTTEKHYTKFKKCLMFCDNGGNTKFFL
jgi:hypothetical protein